MPAHTRNQCKMNEITDFDYNVDDEPQRYGKEWWQDFMDRVKRYNRKSNEYKGPKFFVVRSLKDWDFLDGRWTWPKEKEANEPQP